MDNSPVAASSSAAQNQNNSKSNPVLETTEMETENKNISQDPTPAKTDSESAGAASTAKSARLEDDVSNGKQDTPPAAKADSPSSAKTSDLYPVLPDDTRTAEQDLNAEQATNPASAADKDSLETDSDASLLLAGKDNCQSVLNNQANVLGEESSKDLTNLAQPIPAETPNKGDSAEHNEKQKSDDTAPALSTAKAAASSAEAVSAPATGESVTGQAEASPVSPAADAGAEAGAAGGKNSSPSHGESVYYVKWIMFNNNKVPIITQNENGPCPLLAVMNVLLLKGKVRLAPIVEMITSEQLMAHLGDCVVESMPKNLDETARANYEQNMQDAMDLMHKLQTGLDVNVKFTGVSDFEYTSECIIFDLLEIGLYHGWLVDPQDEESVKAVGKCSYNQLVEKVIQDKQSDNDNMVREALIAEQFLDRTAAQLTYHGLCELSSTVKEQELCVFFRNNHFNTLYRHNNELFLLVTDQGFLTESNVVWETLSNVDGDCHFVDANFCTYTKPQPSTEPIASSPYSSGDEQISSDYQVALSLQHHDQQMIAEQEAAWGQFHNEFGAAQNADHELALRLQEEEDRRAAAAVQEQRNQQAQAQALGQGQGQGQAAAAGGDRRLRDREDRREKKESKDCCIL